MKKTILLSFVAASFLTACNKPMEKVNPLMAQEDEITEIIAGMSLEEKVEMLHGKHMFSSAGIERLGIADIEYADGPFGIREEMEPHSWNSINLGTDSATFFPTGSALAATWSPEMAYQYGKGMAIEARLRGKDMILGPAINIQRKRNADADYSEGLFVGYRWFVTKGAPTMYPFGFGLSYADFKYSDLEAVIKDGIVEVSFKLANNSQVDAEEVAQVYVGRPESQIERPSYELKGFQRVAVVAGASDMVKVCIPLEKLYHWSEATNAWELEKGVADIYVGSSSADLPLKASVKI